MQLKNDEFDILTLLFRVYRETGNCTAAECCYTEKLPPHLDEVAELN